MLRLILALLLLLISTLTIFPVPAKQVWYLAIAVGEFPWVWIIGVTLLLTWICLSEKYRLPAGAISFAALILFSIPVYKAYRIGSRLDERLKLAFGIKDFNPEAPHRNAPFTVTQMISGIGAAKVSVHYVPVCTRRHGAFTHFYPSQISGKRPCLVVVHGGSWKSGNNGELPDVDCYFAKAGYQVATINYRLAPEYKSPAPQEDVHAAFAWLRAHAVELNIDTNNFLLLGRSAGGQIVLTAAYGLHEAGLRGVISFYGPADMIYGYNEPHNQLVMRHQQVMQDFFGGTPATQQQAYLDGSPVKLATAQSVPTLLVHGMLDQHVHYHESEIMDSVLQAKGVPHLLLGLPWATHGCEYSLNGPSGQLGVYAMERFMYAVTQNKIK